VLLSASITDNFESLDLPDASIETVKDDWGVDFATAHPDGSVSAANLLGAPANLRGRRHHTQICAMWCSHVHIQNMQTRQEFGCRKTVMPRILSECRHDPDLVPPASAISAPYLEDTPLFIVLFILSSHLKSPRKCSQRRTPITEPRLYRRIFGVYVFLTHPRQRVTTLWTSSP